MAPGSNIFLDAMLAILIAILAYIAVKKTLLPTKKPTFYEEARGLLEQKIDLKEQVESLKQQFAVGELDSKHYRASLNHAMQELTLIERKLKRIGF